MKSILKQPLANGSNLYFTITIWAKTIFEIFAKIRDFRENPRFSRKCEIFVKIRDFRENPRFSRKSEIFAKIRDFRKNPRFSQKSESFFLNFCGRRQDGQDPGGRAVPAPSRRRQRPQEFRKKQLKKRRNYYLICFFGAGWVIIASLGSVIHSPTQAQNFCRNVDSS